MRSSIWWDFIRISGFEFNECRIQNANIIKEFHAMKFVEIKTK